MGKVGDGGDDDGGGRILPGHPGPIPSRNMTIKNPRKVDTFRKSVQQYHPACLGAHYVASMCRLRDRG